MQIVDAQRDVRLTFLANGPGALVSGLIWLASAGVATWATPRLAMMTLVLGGTFIFPLSQLVLRAMGRRAALLPENPMGQLAMQVAFTIPASYPLVGAGTLHRLEWFYPAFMIVVGAHYLPFMFLYGMPAFLAIALLMVGGGFAIGAWLPGSFALGGWVTGALLLLWSAFGFMSARRELAGAPGR